MIDPDQEIARAERAVEDADALLSPAQVGRLVGFSASFVRLEIRAGAIRAVRAGRGPQRKRWRITLGEARRYRQQLLGADSA